MKIGSTLSYKKIVHFLVDMELGRINKFLSQVNKQSNLENEEIEKVFGSISKARFESEYEYQSYLDSFSDDVYLLNQVKDLSEQLAIIAQYKLVETKSVLALKVYSNNIKKPESLHRFPILKKRLQTLGINIEKLSNYELINELRLINNDIKHSGVVTNNDLTKYGWVIGEKFESLSTYIKKFKKAIPEYLEDLIDKLEKKKRPIVSIKKRR